MKKILGLLNILMLTTVLTACARVIEYDPIKVDGFEVTVETTLTIDQGEHELDEEELLELLPELFTEVGIDAEDTEETDLALDIEAPETTFTFLMELAEYELYHEGVDEAEDFTLPIESLELSIIGGETTSFDDIEFTDAGTYTFKITQVVNDEEVEENDYETTENYNWTLDETAYYITVTITEDEENELLVASVSNEEIIFVNEYTYSIEEQITEAKEELERLELESWEARVAEAYVDGYTLTRDADGNETRTVIYVPEPVVELPTHQYQPETGNNQNNTNQSPSETTALPPNNNNDNTVQAPPIQEINVGGNDAVDYSNCDFVWVGGGFIGEGENGVERNNQTYDTWEMVCP